jgi:SAM-dependent methyltransferase
MIGIFSVLCRQPAMRRYLWRQVYRRLSASVQDPRATFLNYGYAATPGNGSSAVGQLASCPDRYSVDLYRHVVGAVDARGMNLLEIGSGRGAGLAYLATALQAASAVGLDYAESAVRLGAARYANDRVSFVTGDAERLPFPDRQFDVIVNIESSHCYGSVRDFLDGVRRVLRSGGHFLFADFRDAEDLVGLERELGRSGLKTLEREDVTQNVLAALDADGPRRLRLIASMAPAYLRSSLVEFAGIPGSRIYRAFASGRTHYVRFALRKST